MWHYDLYWHHAIVEEVGVSTVTLIEYNSKGEIVRSSRNVAENKAPLYLVAYTEGISRFNPVQLVLARANSLLGLEGYNLLKRNCENFATFCKTGVNCNQQQNWFKKRITDILGGIGVKNAERCLRVSRISFHLAVFLHFVGLV